MITLVMPTYNRAHTLGRAVQSLRAQTRSDWELVVVDGASTDDTAGVIARIGEPRVRYVRERRNDGITAARNRGLDEARGDWIGMLDSDDELLPHALETLLLQLDLVSPALDAISCNCVDARTGRFTGHGLTRDGFLTVPRSIGRARGEHWGIFRRSLVGGRRFHPAIRGFEGHLWCRIHDGALWYYVHRGLRVYHREGADRNTRRPNIDYDLYRQILAHDPDLVRLYARWSPAAFRRLMTNAAVAFLRAGDWSRCASAVRTLYRHGP